MTATTTWLDTKRWGQVAIIAGIGWALAPLPLTILEMRVLNAAYLLPLGLMFGTFYMVGDHIASSSLSLIGYLITGIGMIVLAAGSLMETLYDVGTLVTWGVAQGQVFYLGLLGILLGSLFLGAGLIRERKMMSAGIGLVLVLPVTVVGFWGFDMMGWGTFNWMPITVPYGGAWVILGLEILRDAKS